MHVLLLDVTLDLLFSQYTGRIRTREELKVTTGFSIQGTWYPRLKKKILLTAKRKW